MAAKKGTGAAAKEMAKATQLPPREAQNFRAMVKMYENKQFRKAVKMCDSILKKAGEHGETVAMKGLILSNIVGKRDEAYECAKRGLKLDISSPMCWHILGIMYRHDKDHLEAIKCFMHAHRIEPSNLQILRDLACLQVHRRFMDGHRDSRRKLLTLRPSLKPHWTAMAVSHHLCGEFDSALRVLTLVEENFDIPEGYERSELQLYKATILEEAGRYLEALEFLRSKKDSFTDDVAVWQTEARLCIYLSKFDEAYEALTRVIKRCPEHQDAAFLCLALHTLCRNIFVFPCPPERAPSEEKPASADEGKSSARMELSPLLLFPGGRKRSGWPTIASQRWHDSVVRVGIGQRNTIRGSATGLDETVGHQGSPPPFGWKRKVRDECQVLFRRIPSAGHELLPRPACSVPTEDSALSLDAADSARFKQAWLDLKDTCGCETSDTMNIVLPLHFLREEELSAHVDQFLRPMIRKQGTSSFEFLKPFYTAENAEIFGRLLQSYVASLKNHKRFSENEAGNEESPICLPTAQLILAQHLDFIGKPQEGLQILDEAVEHTPTMIELHMAKGILLRHLGAYDSASETLEEARHMDLADRFINVKSVKYLLRDGMREKGEEVARLFSRQSDVDGKHDMQSMWFELAVAENYRSGGEVGPALARYAKILGYFAQIREDQFDFHHYCLRRHAVRQYIDFLRMNDRLESQRSYRKAAEGSVEIFLELASCSSKKPLAVDGEKEEKKEKSEVEKKTSKAQEKKEKASATDPKESEDVVEGKKILEKDSLEEAERIAKTLRTNAWIDSTSHVISVDVATMLGRRGVLVGLQGLLRVWRLSGYSVYQPQVALSFVEVLVMLLSDNEDMRGLTTSEDCGAKDAREATVRGVEQGQEGANGEMSRKMLDRKLAVADASAKLVASHLSEMAGRKVRVVESDGGLRVVKPDVNAILLEFLEKVVKSFAATKSAISILQGFRCLEAAKGVAECPNTPLVEALTGENLIDVLRSATLPECEQLTKWLRRRKEEAIGGKEWEFVSNQYEVRPHPFTILFRKFSSNSVGLPPGRMPFEISSR